MGSVCFHQVEASLSYEAEQELIAREPTMVAYSFKDRFVPQIRSGQKCQTIRAHRRRHARPGEEVQLYEGMRTRSCQLIGRACCVRASNIYLNLDGCGMKIEDEPHARFGDLDNFARSDGFEDWAGLVAFWRTTYHCEDFYGVLIQWDPATFKDGSSRSDEHL